MDTVLVKTPVKLTLKQFRSIKSYRQFKKEYGLLFLIKQVSYNATSVDFILTHSINRKNAATNVPNNTIKTNVLNPIPPIYEMRSCINRCKYILKCSVTRYE